MEFWLVQDQDRLLLPVTPYPGVGDSQNNTTVELNEVGTVNIAGKKGLRKVNIESFFPAQLYPFVASTEISTDPYYYYNKIKAWKDAGLPVRVIMTETPHNFECLIDTFDVHEEDGSNSVYYTLNMSEYIRLEMKEAPKPKPKKKVEYRRGAATKVNTDKKSPQYGLTPLEVIAIGQSIPENLKTTEEIDAYCDARRKELIDRKKNPQKYPPKKLKGVEELRREREAEMAKKGLR